MIDAAVRAHRPLVHCITNFVTMEWVARGLLAAGARPLMARDPMEAAAAAGGAAAVVLNLGTWSPEAQKAMLAAGRAANDRGRPVVLDPVGAGGLPTRLQAAQEILAEVRVAAIRGNAGEIAALAGTQGLVAGVDARAGAAGIQGLAAARSVAKSYRCVVAATGPVDLVTDGDRSLEVRAGHPLLAQIPGAGCLASGLLAAALAAVPAGGDALQAVAEALLWAGAAGEEAAARSAGPGSFAAAFLDALASAAAGLPAGRIAPPLADRLALYLIVSGLTPDEAIRAALVSGVTAVQFREKSLPLSAQVTAARRVAAICREHGALFLVNDRVDLALAAGADGAHVGQDDLPVAEARRLLGPRAIIGATCETPDEARIAEAAGADYIGTGPVYATPSKADAGEPYGPAVVERVCAAVAIPVVGIGGIAAGGAAPVIRAGACGAAVISGILKAPDPGLAARSLYNEIRLAKGDE